MSKVFLGQQVNINASPAITWESRASLWAAGTPIAMTSTASGWISQTFNLEITFSR